MSDTVWLALIVAISGAFTAWLNYRLSAKTDGKLGQIHELVNSSMDAQMRDTLSSKKAQLVTLDQLLSLQQSDGKTTSRDATMTRNLLVTEILKLEAKLRDRAEQTKIADSKLV